ncbi:MAG TPA: tetratricopeptide repeat protein [Dehalococcoidia bacterium]|nr:tetratricopeptide repeat protein [Dehalococcoidia bacterium]
MPDADELLKLAQELHTQGRIDDALETARQALEARPDYVEAWMYYGTTLITRRLIFREGLEALERAYELAPDDPGVAYSMGWCYEFVAYRLEKQATKPYRDPIELYRLAAERLLACIALDPEQGLKDDARDLLDSIEARLE